MTIGLRGRKAGTETPRFLWALNSALLRNSGGRSTLVPKQGLQGRSPLCPF